MLFAIFVDIVVASHDQEVFAGTSQYIEVLEYLDGWFIVFYISFGYSHSRVDDVSIFFAELFLRGGQKRDADVLDSSHDGPSYGSLR